MAQQQITLLGCGKMGSAMLEGWLADTNLDANFTIIEPHQTHLGWLQGQKSVRLYADCAAANADGAPVSSMILKELGIEKGSGETPREVVGELSKEQVRKIAEAKMADLNANDVEQAMKIIEGTCRSMGVEVK